MATRKRIVVIGGGFAGLTFVKAIDKKRYDVLLVDRNNYHSFPPLFYQVASCGIDPESVCFPFRREFQRGKAKGARFHMGEVRMIDRQRQCVITQFETIPYDVLVIAAGSTNNYFGNNALEKYVFTLKSTSEALRIRNEVLESLERACLSKDAEVRKRKLTFVVVGGGASGVEMAGALGEMKRWIIGREYTSLRPEEVKVVLVEGASDVLGAMDSKCRTSARQYLKELMVDVKTGVRTESFSDGVLRLSNGEEMEVGTLIWTAGVKGVEFAVSGEPLPMVAAGRMAVDACNLVKGSDAIYAIGDVCFMENAEGYSHGHPQLAQVAIQQARNLAENLNNDSRKPFVYHDKGTMATVGRNRAVAQSGKITLTGFVAWAAWMGVHLMSLLGMRNKLAVLTNWVWSYFSHATALRVLIHSAKYPLRRRWGER